MSLGINDENRNNWEATLASYVEVRNNLRAAAIAVEYHSGIGGALKWNCTEFVEELSNSRFVNALDSQMVQLAIELGHPGRVLVEGHLLPF